MDEKHSLAGTTCIHSSVDGNMRCVCLWAIMNSLALSVHAQVLCKHLFSVLLGTYPKVELLSLIKTLYLTLGNHQTIFQNGGPIYIPTSNVQNSSFSISLPTLVIVHLFYCSYPGVCEVISHCDFYLHFSND